MCYALEVTYENKKAYTLRMSSQQIFFSDAGCTRVRANKQGRIALLRC